MPVDAAARGKALKASTSVAPTLLVALPVSVMVVPALTQALIVPTGIPVVTSWTVTPLPPAPVPKAASHAGTEATWSVGLAVVVAPLTVIWPANWALA